MQAYTDISSAVATSAMRIALQVTHILSQLSLIPAHTGLDACSKAAEVLLQSLSQSQAVDTVR
jgi:hypothetical protein